MTSVKQMKVTPSSGAVAGLSEDCPLQHPSANYPAAQSTLIARRQQKAEAQRKNRWSRLLRMDSAPRPNVSELNIHTMIETGRPIDGPWATWKNEQGAVPLTHPIAKEPVAEHDDPTFEPLNAVSPEHLAQMFAQRLQTIAYMRRVVDGNEVFLYSICFRSGDFGLAVSSDVLDGWTAYCVKVRSTFLLALQDTSPDIVHGRIVSLSRTSVPDWDKGEANPALEEATDQAPTDDVAETKTVEALSKLLSAMCALYAKLLACVDKRFPGALHNDAMQSPLEAEALYGPLPLETLLEPFPEMTLYLQGVENAGSLKTLHTLDSIHGALSVSSSALTPANH